MPARVVVAPDKFRGSLTAGQAAAAMARGARAARPSAAVAEHPVADGGEGTVAACLRAGYRAIGCRVTGPTGEPVRARYALSADTAVVELAQAAGLARLPGGRVAPRGATTRGVGEMIRDALDHGARRIVLGIGGSASTDGGAGIVAGLGGELRDQVGRPVPDGGAGLLDATQLDLAGLDPRLPGVELLVACDVDNPLLGPRGAAAVYGPQKGAAQDDVRVLEAGLAQWARLAAGAGRPDLREAPGAGAAGGAGFGLAAVLGARLVPGTELLLRITGFGALLARASLVLTGEGSLDRQSLRGKAPVGVARIAAAHGVPVAVIAGRSELAEAEARQAGFGAVYTLAGIEPDPDRQLAEAAMLLQRLAGRAVSDLLPG